MVEVRSDTLLVQQFDTGINWTVAMNGEGSPVQNFPVGSRIHITGLQIDYNFIRADLLSFQYTKPHYCQLWAREPSPMSASLVGYTR